MRIVALAALVLLIATLFTASSVLARGQNWAVLVSGSNQYYNYRHQSDVCHAFQLLKKLGVPEENIITMMSDDIADNRQNPKKGSIVNIPGGPNVYPGVKIDYKDNDVTAKNFLAILRGEKTTGGNGKTLQTGPEDNIFVFYTDHGGPGLIAMPVGGYLYAKDLLSTLKHMHENKKYKELVFYLEACESGSMFNNLLPSDWNIWATTASNPFQSSYACDYDSTYNAYLNDCWSRNWMIDTEAKFGKLGNYTLQQQFDVVKNMTKESPACLYGDLSMGKNALGDYITGPAKNNFIADAFRQNFRASASHSVSKTLARNVKTEWLQKQAERAQTAIEKRQWSHYLKQHKLLTSHYEVMFSHFENKFNLVPTEQKLANAGDRCHDKKSINVECVKEAVEAFERACGEFREEGLFFTHSLSNACDSGVSIDQIETHFTAVCKVLQVPAALPQF